MMMRIRKTFFVLTWCHGSLEIFNHKHTIQTKTNKNKHCWFACQFHCDNLAMGKLYTFSQLEKVFILLKVMTLQ